MVADSDKGTPIVARRVLRNRLPRAMRHPLTTGRLADKKVSGEGLDQQGIRRRHEKSLSQLIAAKGFMRWAI